MSQSWKPGEVAPESGNYNAYDSQGHKLLYKSWLMVYIKIYFALI